MQVKSVKFSSDGKRSEFHNNKQAQMKGKKRGRGGGRRQRIEERLEVWDNSPRSWPRARLVIASCIPYNLWERGQNS